MPPTKLEGYRAFYRARIRTADVAWRAQCRDEQGDAGAFDDLDKAVSRIAKDVPRTYSGLSDDSWWDWFRTEDRRLLSRLLCVGSELVGYSQGMNFVAAALVSDDASRSEDGVFALYAYVMEDLKIKWMHGRTLAAYLGSLSLALRTQAPRVHAFLNEMHFEPQLYAVEWFSALFTISVPTTLSLALFDLVFARVVDAPLRFAVGLLSTLESTLCRLSSFDDLAMQFKRIVRTADPVAVLLATLAVDADIDSLASLAIPPTVYTSFGTGRLREIRDDSFAVVDLHWGSTAFLNANAVHPPPVYVHNDDLANQQQDDLPLPALKRPASPGIKLLRTPPSDDAAPLSAPDDDDQRAGGKTAHRISGTPTARGQFDWIFSDLIF